MLESFDDNDTIHFLSDLHFFVLSRRFTEQIVFNNWDPQDCVDLFMKKCQSEAVEYPEGLNLALLSGFDDLIQRDGWGNAGDVNTVYDKTRASRDLRSDDEGIIEGGYLLEDVISAFDTMKLQRQKKIGKWILIQND